MSLPGLHSTCKSLVLAGAMVLSSLGAGSFAAPGVETGNAVLVIYNSRMPESRRVAEYYAARRQVPQSQVAGFDLPSEEAISRKEFVQKLQDPLWAMLKDRGLITATEPGKAASNALARAITQFKIRYLVPCYGVPVRISEDPGLIEPETEKLPAPLRHNAASVDGELACLSLLKNGAPRIGPLQNVFYGATNAGLLSPSNNVLLVGRLDGPSPEIACGLVDKAMQAETNGLWGRAFFDIQSTNGAYKMGDDQILQASQLATRLGFETMVETNPWTFRAGFPMDHVAFYAGWYDADVSGPFTTSEVDFMPGAFAFHLHSMSAEVLRTTNQHWVGPLLAKGATISMGTVEEPYLSGVPDVFTFLARFTFFGFSFGEAAYASEPWLSWKVTVVGDPLYRPFAIGPQARHQQLEARNSELLEWSVLQYVNLNMAARPEPTRWVDFLGKLPLTSKSAVLQEKLAELCWSNARLSMALEYYEQALKLNPSPRHKERLLLNWAERQAIYGPDRAAFAIYERLLKEVPDYPDRPGIYRRQLALAKSMEQPELIGRLEQLLGRAVTNAPARP